jgi:Predicted Zn-dependent proteases and their inactivated homologs
MNVDYSMAEYALSTLKQAGASQAQCMVSCSSKDEITVTGGNFTLMRTVFDKSLSLKAVSNGKSGSITVNGHDRQTVDNAVKACIDSMNSSTPDIAEGISDEANEESFASGSLISDRDGLFDRLREFMTDAKDCYPKVVLDHLVGVYEQKQMAYLNTIGCRYEYKTGGYGMDMMFTAKEGTNTSSFNEYSTNFGDTSHRLMELGMIQRLLSDSEQQLVTRTAGEKYCGTLVISPACLGVILRSVLQRFTSDVALIRGSSLWKNMLNRQVADKVFNLSTIPLDDRMISGERFTADGYKSENSTIIENGILQSFILSRYGALKTGMERRGNSSFNLCVSPGDKAFGDIIKGIERGILLNRFSGGMPAANGDFSGVAKNSFLIKNGAISGALRETMVSGNLADMLNNINGISAESICDGKTVLPWMAFDGITIQ